MRKKLRLAASALLDYTKIPYRRECLRMEGRPNAVFIWIPKTAGTSIWQAMDVPKLKSLHLAKHRFAGHGPVTFCHMDYARLVEKGYISQTFNDSAYKFTFVRNPYDRA
ncbi:MAG: sulfotransferase family 2 domain-containing protein, partial [Kiritimatiellales bacterium]|nr:sulfotransferase family 2 domain-containing protein [Kiritimatiellales bacterium]